MKEAGGDLPATATPPTPHLSWSLGFYIRAFDTLDTCRPISSECFARIPWTSVIMYADRYCLNESQHLRFQRYMLAMDAAYVTHLNKKIKRR